MQRRFFAAGGSEECRRCHGQCCDCGRNHFTLVNLLGFLLQGQRPPEPDFEQPCPFLGESGCRLEVARRPYNCVTFICEQIEGRMSRSDRQAFYVDEAQLRLLHEQFDRRYALSSPRGLLIRAARLGDEPLLAPLRQSDFEAPGSADRRSSGVHL
ncbi:MAG: hypothetical protein GWN87_05100 [Desulfuromonadales bacterium]|nr:hypothetical protein [Desulfuromonadales bacterium]NIS44132.1 hypothetical protein [Desulfuromonadales bacterium]